jgi:hypothetical protein
MAQIDPNIALGFRMPQFQDPIAATARAQEIGVNALKMNEMQRGLESQNKLRELYSQGVDISTPEGFKQVAAIDPATAMKLRTDALQGQKLQGDIKKTGLEIDEKNMNLFRERIGSLEFNPSNANIQAFLEDSVLRGEITPQQAQQRFAQATAVPLDQRPSYFRNMGVKTEERYKMNTISAAQQQTADVTKRGQDIGAETARRGQDIGRIPVGYRMTPEGTIEAIPGGPTTTNLSPKEIQLRESKFPQATQAVNTFEAKTTELEKDLLALKNHPGLSSITGIAAGRAPGLTSQGRAAEALYDKITARGGFKELQDMRAASPTGGALGNVSNQEGAQLRAAFAAIDRKQDAADVKKAIDTALADLKASKGRVREAYDMTYDYKGGGGATPPPPPPPAPGAGGNTVTIPGGKVLTFPTPEAAAAYKQAAGL